MRPRQTRIIVATVVLAVSSALVLTGCSSNSDTNTGLSAQYRDGGTKNYVSGDGTVTQVPTANRKTVIDFDEVSSDGEPMRSADLQGKVVVLNFWYAACPPCRAEAKHLNTVWDRYQDQNVQMIGVNVRDAKGTADAFERRFNIPYPSVLDNDLQWRLAELMVQMWNGARIEKNNDLTEDEYGIDDSLQLKVRCRHSMSLVFDSIWHWREEYQARGRGNLEGKCQTTTDGLSRNTDISRPSANLVVICSGAEASDASSFSRGPSGLCAP